MYGRPDGAVQGIAPDAGSGSVAVASASGQSMSIVDSKSASAGTNIFHDHQLNSCCADSDLPVDPSERLRLGIITWYALLTMLLQRSIVFMSVRCCWREPKADRSRHSQITTAFLWLQKWLRLLKESKFRKRVVIEPLQLLSTRRNTAALLLCPGPKVTYRSAFAFIVCLLTDKHSQVKAFSVQCDTPRAYAKLERVVVKVKGDKTICSCEPLPSMHVLCILVSSFCPEQLCVHAVLVGLSFSPPVSDDKRMKKLIFGSKLDEDANSTGGPRCWLLENLCGAQSRSKQVSTTSTKTTRQATLRLSHLDSGKHSCSTTNTTATKKTARSDVTSALRSSPNVLTKLVLREARPEVAHVHAGTRFRLSSDQIN